MTRRQALSLLLGLLAPLPRTALAGRAVDFQFTDIYGKTLRLSAFRGKWVLVFVRDWGRRAAGEQP